MRTKIALLCVTGLALTFGTCSISANPTGGSVVGGDANATITGEGSSLTTINQSANRVIINWQDFSIGSGELTTFVQPSSTAAALNRVVSGDPTKIFGSLHANGQVFVINPNGILVGKGGVIDTKGFVASTLNLSDSAFLSGTKMIFSGKSAAAVQNQGSIQALGGDVYLIAHHVENDGTVRAPQGTVGLAAGSDVQLVQSGEQHLSVLAGTPDSSGAAGVNNLGVIQAASAELKAAGGNIYALAINNGGVVRATGIVRKNGHIYLAATGGNILNSGTLEANNADGSGGAITLDGGHNASAPSTVVNSGTIAARGDAAGTQGGTVEVLGDNVRLQGSATVDVSGDAGGGTALIGGDTHGANPAVQNATLTTVDPGAQIHADALSSGDGGKVVVWSDDTTKFQGTIFARALGAEGQGGFAEISGKQHLLVGGYAYLGGANGLKGQLLLDPGSVAIMHEASGQTPPSANLDVFYDDYLVNQLNTGGADVLVSTANSLNGSAEDLTVQTGADVSWNSANSLTLVGNNSLTLQSGSTLANLGSGSLTLQSGSGSVAMSGTVNMAGDLNISAGTTVAFDGATTVGGNLGVTAGGAISQTAAITANGAGATATFAAGSANNITLGDSGNDFTTVAISSGNGVTLVDANSIDLGASTVSGTLDVTAGSDITESGALSVGGNSSFTYSGALLGNVLLGSAANDFGGHNVSVSASGAGSIQDVALRNVSSSAGFNHLTLPSGLRNLTVLFDAASITIPAMTLSGNLTVTANGITDGGALVVPGTTTLNAGGNNITFNNNDDFGTLAIGSAQNATIKDINAIDLGASTLSGNLTINASGPITESGALTVNGAGATATFTAGAANNVTLGTAANDFTTVAIVSGNDVTLNDVNGIDLGASTVSGNLTVTANGAITQSGTLSASGAGTIASFTAGSANDITLGGNNDDFTTVVIGSGHNVTLNDANALDLGASTVSGNLGVTAHGTLTQSGALTVNGAGATATFGAGSGNDITLDNAANDFTTAAVSSGRNVTLVDVNALDLGASTVSGNLDVTANGAITQSGALAVNGTSATTTLTAGAANDITLDNAANNFRTVVVVSGNNVSLVDANALDLGASTVSGNLDVTAGGNLTQSGALTVNGAGANATFSTGSGNDITLDNAANDFTTAAATSGRNVTLVDVNALDLGASTVSGNLTVTAGGSITESGALSVNGSGKQASFTVTAAGSDVLLDSQANDFTAVAVSGPVNNLGIQNIDAAAAIPTLPANLNDLTLIFNNAAITLPGLALSGNLSVTAGGPITQSGALTVNGAGATATFAAGPANNITLDSGNDFTTVAIGSGNNVTLNDANALQLGASTVSGNLTVTAGGPISQSGALTANGAGKTATFAAGAANNITLGDSGNDFTTVAIGSGNDVTLNDANALQLGASTVSGNLTVTAGGPISQSGALTANGAGKMATFAAGAANNITLGDSGNDFTTVAIGSGNDVMLDDASALNLGASTVSGNLDVTAGGPITQSGALTVNGAGKTATFAAGAANNIALNNAANDFTTVAIGSGNNVTLADANAIDLGASTVSGTLSVTAKGDITESGAVSATAGSSLFTIDTVTASVLLGSQPNHFGAQPVTISTVNGGLVQDVSFRNIDGAALLPALPSGVLRNVTLAFDAAPITLPALSLSGNLSVTAGGPITQSGVLTVNGAGATATFAAGSANDITLNNSGNDFTTVAVNSAHNVSLADANALNLGASTISGNLIATAGGPITQSGALSVNGAGAAATFTVGAANDLTLDDAGNDFTTVSIGSANNVTLADANALDLGASTVSGNLSVTANGPITQSGMLTVNGVGMTATFAAGSGNNITLDNAANDFTTVSVGSGHNVSLADANAINLGAMSLSGNLSVSANGPITQSAALTLNGAGQTATFAAGSANDIKLNNAGNDFNTVSIGSGNNVTLVDANGIDLGASVVSGNLSVIAGGPIIQSGALTINGVGTTAAFAAGAANNIVLGNSGNDFSTVVINSGNNVTLDDANAINLGASTVSGNLTVSASGPITQTGPLLVNGDGKTATFTAGSVNDITLKNGLNDFTIVSIGSARNVDLRDVNSIKLGNANVTGNYNVTTGGAATKVGILNVGGVFTVNGINNSSYNQSIASFFVVNIPLPKLQTLSFSGTAISTEEAAKLLPPGSIGTLWLQLPFPPPAEQHYRIEEISKWTGGNLAVSGNTSGPQTPR